MTDPEDSRVRAILAARMTNSNAIIEALATHGRRAFYSAQYDLTGLFFVDSSLQGWWIDHRTGMKIEASRASLPYGEPERGLVAALYGYIKSGKPITVGWLDDRWEYGGDMEAVREVLRDNQAVQHQKAQICAPSEIEGGNNALRDIK